MPARRAAQRPHESIAVIFLLVTFPLLLSGCSDDSGRNPGRTGDRLVPAVEVVQADYGSLPLSERLNGLVRAKNQVELFPQISAAVVQVYVQNGDRTKAGEPLVRLRDTELRERLKQAEASYQIAAAQAKQAEAELQRVQAELRRSSGLAEKDLISPTEFETAQTQAIAAEADAELARARVEQARATVDERQEALSRTVIRAPVDGTVGNRNAEVGMVVTPGNRLFTLGQLDSLTVEVVITDRMLSYIQKSQRTEVSSPAIPFGSLEAPLARISPFLHPVSHSTRAEIDFINPDGALNPGMFVTVDIFYGESEQATIVPLSALWENPATASVGVFVSRDSLTGEPVSGVDAPGGGSLTNPVSFAFIPVEVIARGRMSAGVRGVHPGNWVVTLGQDLLEGDSAQARARLVNWEWVERLQQLQREDLLDEIILRREKKAVDTSLIGAESSGREGRS